MKPIPKHSEPIAGSALMSMAWYRYLQSIAGNGGTNAAEFEELRRLIASKQDAAPIFSTLARLTGDGYLKRDAAGLFSLQMPKATEIAGLGAYVLARASLRI